MKKLNLKSKSNKGVKTRYKIVLGNGALVVSKMYDSMESVHKFLDEDILKYDDIQQSVMVFSDTYKVQDNDGLLFIVYISPVTM